jgi:hypothetical protein
VTAPVAALTEGCMAHSSNTAKSNLLPVIPSSLRQEVNRSDHGFSVFRFENSKRRTLSHFSECIALFQHQSDTEGVGLRQEQYKYSQCPSSFKTQISRRCMACGLVGGGMSDYEQRLE